ncbi:hypothetical protein KM043_000660 [Ampulex compressa]|nr:hypothetical protein KM043_000660 [Ampulex compressa]
MWRIVALPRDPETWNNRLESARGETDYDFMLLADIQQPHTPFAKMRGPLWIAGNSFWCSPTGNAYTDVAIVIRPRAGVARQPCASTTNHTPADLSGPLFVFGKPDEIPSWTA